MSVIQILSADEENVANVTSAQSLQVTSIASEPLNATLVGLDDTGVTQTAQRVDTNGLAHVHAQIYSTHQHDTDLHITPHGEAMVQETLRLIGPSFSGAALDTTAWLHTPTNGGTIALTGSVATLATGTTANAASQLDSVRRARFFFAHPNKFRVALRVPQAGHADNIVRWGVDDGTDGTGFSLGADPANPTRLGVWCRANGGAPTEVTSAFAGELGVTKTLDTNVHAFEVVYYTMAVYFYYDGALLHVIRPTTAPYAGNLSLPICVSITNRNGSTTSRSVEVWNASVLRQGAVEPRMQYVYIAANGTTVVKRGPSTLHHVVIVSSGTGGNTVSLYDAVSAVGTPIVLDTVAAALGTINLDINFDVGLTAVMASGVAAKVVIAFD